MSEKDLYAVLQVHHEAEPMVIDAAYRRLSREYHPDVNKAASAHEFMVGLNRAYEVLSDPTLRREYDASRAHTDGRRSSPPTDSPARTTRRQTAPTASVTIPAPVPPAPGQYGITATYFDKATEGALEWKKRKPALPIAFSIPLRSLAWLSGLGLMAYGLSDAGKDMFIIPGLAWLGIPIIIEAAIAGLQTRHDSKLKALEFNPRYNPNPVGYADYAKEFAKYETEMATVYVPRSGSCFHFHSYCGSMISPNEVPKYIAEAKGYAPCSRCGHYSVRIKVLPPPFGDGLPPK